MIVDADELEVGKVAISDGLEEVGDILPVDVVVFQMHLVISHSSGKHQGGVQSLNTMVLSQCPDVDTHGLIVGRRESKDFRVSVPNDHDVQDPGLITFELAQFVDGPLDPCLLPLTPVGRDLPVGSRFVVGSPVNPMDTSVTPFAIHIIPGPPHDDQHRQNRTTMGTIGGLDVIDGLGDILDHMVQSLAPQHFGIYATDVSPGLEKIASGKTRSLPCVGVRYQSLSDESDTISRSTSPPGG